MARYRAPLRGLVTHILQSCIQANPTADPCEAMHYLGFFGIEKKVVAMIADWIKKPSN